MISMLQDALLFCSAWIIFVPVIIAIFSYRHFNPGLRVLCIHLFIACTVEVISYIWMKQKWNNLPFLHFYTISEFILLYLFYDIFFGNTFPKRLLRGIAISFVLFSVINSLFIQNIFEFNSYARGLEALLLIILSLLCFYKISISPQDTGGIPWINAGILVYFSGGLTLFILSNYILPFSNSINTLIWAIHSFLSIFLYIVISIGLWKSRTR